MESFLSSFTSGTTVKAGKAAEKDYLGSDKIRICVVGVGGGGCNSITRIMKSGIKTADTIAINTDMNHLKITEAHKRLLIGQSITRGLGAGGYPEIARKAAEASKDKLAEALSGADLVFLTAGMGGGTGTGAAPVVAEVAKKEGAIVVGMVTYPFSLERARTEKARWGLEELRKACDTVVVIDNNRLVQYVPNLPMNEAFNVADEILARAIKGISDTIMTPSLINIDFADIRAIMGNGGVAMLSVGEGKGTNKVEDAIKSTLEHPLLDISYEGAKGALIHIAGGPNLTLGEATKIGEGITNAFDNNANVIWGARLMPELGDKVVVTAIMTGVTSTSLLGNLDTEKQKVPQAYEMIEELVW
jgi:cell division protein FtsZ